MIQILQNWGQIGEAIGYLYSMGKDKSKRVFHGTPLKNWDLAQIAKLLYGKSKLIYILDMGCGGSSVLRFCHMHGFKKVYGIDLSIGFQDRWQQLMFWKDNRFQLPYHLNSQSVTKTNFPDNFFDLLICLSVIEHGVNVADFLKECSRILKGNGLLYISTDYWPTKINTFNAPLNYGSNPGEEWNIFSKNEINQLINKAYDLGFRLKRKQIPKSGAPIVNWNRKKYTFLSLLFTNQ